MSRFKDLWQRTKTGAVIVLTLCAGIYFQGWLLRLILLFCMIMCLKEMYFAFRKINSDPVRWAGYVYCVLAVLAQSFHAYMKRLSLFTAISPPMFALVVGLLLAMTVIVLRGKVAFDSLASTMFPMLYPGLFFSLILSLQDLDTRLASTLALFLTFFLASINDVFALLVGMTFGKHKLSPQISPKKTIEGAIGGVVASVIFSMLVPTVTYAIAPYFPKVSAQLAVTTYPPLWAFALYGFVASIFSQIGDLVASLIKRHCDIKDFGNLLPGHGGMMDRMDGILFCGVISYAFFRLAGL